MNVKRVLCDSIGERCCEGVEQLAGMSLKNAVRLDASHQVCLSLTYIFIFI